MAISKKQEVINIKSYDMDGCLLHKKSADVVEDNELLLAMNAQEIIAANYSRVIIMSFSNRQSCAIDEINVFINQTPDSFTALMQYRYALSLRITTPCEVDRTLLSDIYGKKPLGENFSKALENDYDYDFSRWLFDYSKLTILYLHMHKAASDNPHASFVHDVYDDRYMRKDILNRLVVFLTENSEWIPENLTIRIHFYNGKSYHFVREIKGTGLIDANCSENIWLMLYMAGLSFQGKNDRSCDVMQALTDKNNVKNFLETRNLLKGYQYDFFPAYQPEPAHFYKKMSTTIRHSEKTIGQEKNSQRNSFFEDVSLSSEKKIVSEEDLNSPSCIIF